MSVTQFSASNIQDMVTKNWSDIFMDELRADLMLGALVNKDYEGQIANLGDKVEVSQVNAPDGQLLTVGTDADSFATQTLSSTSIEIKADKRAVAAYEFEDTVKLMSQLGNQDSAIRQSLVYAISKQINDYLYSLFVPSTSSPDHLLNSVTDFNAAQLNACRLLAAQAKWNSLKPWYALLDPSYYTDMLNATTMVNNQYIGNETPTVSGKIAMQRFGFNILEDNSRTVDTGFLFHPDFMHLVMKTQPTFQVSSLHSQKKFGYIISVDMIFGAKLGIDGNKKCIKVLAA